MSRIQRVLFPTDFSLGCQALVPTVRRMIEYWQADVTLLHVIERRSWLEPEHELDRILTQMKAIATEGLRASRVRYCVERGASGDRISEHVRSKGVDLVVMSAVGSSNRYGGPIGSVADEVLTTAPCPVWLDWGSARCRSTAGMYARQVGCALALNDFDESVLRVASEISGDLEAGLTVIHAVEAAPGRPMGRMPDQCVRNGVLAMANRRIDGLLRLFHPEADVAVEVGSSHSVVSRVLQEHEVGLLVTGNSREAIFAARSECPVLRLSIPVATAAETAKPEPQYAIAAMRSA